jgi:hypothetical protein
MIHLRFEDGTDYELGQRVLTKLAPKCNDFCVRVHNYGKGLYFNFTHHDNPVSGDMIYLTPCAASSCP